MDDWRSPDYKLVDIVEHEMKIEKRRSIEDFCFQFFKDYWGETTAETVQICRLFIKERRLHSIVEDTFKYVTRENFATSFQSMCMELFKDDVIKDEYIVSLLIFCIDLDSCLQQYEWYSTSILIEVLVEALDRIHFRPHTFNWNRSSSIDTIIKSFIIIVPSLLFFYILFK